MIQAELLQENNYLPEILKSLDKAKTEILASIYLCKYVRRRATDPARKIIMKLIEMHKRGVRVSVIFHIGKIKRQIPGWNLLIAQDIEKEGLKVKLWREKRIFHSKLFVIDRKLLFIGSHNISNTSLTESVELSMKYEDEIIGKKAAVIFSEWWKQGV